MALTWMWPVSTLLLLGLTVALAWAQVRRRGASPRVNQVDWPAAVLLELTVIGAVVENLMLVDVLYAGPPSARTATSLLPAAVVSIVGFALSIALLALHRHYELRGTTALLWRRIGVCVPAAIGFAALTSISVSIATAASRTLTPAVLSVLGGPALTTVVGIALATYAFSVLRVPRQRIPEEPEPPTVSPVDSADEKNPISTTTSRADTWEPYRRPSSP